VAVLEDFQGQIVAAVGIVGFLDDLDARGAAFTHQFLRHLQRTVAPRHDVVELPAALGALPFEDLEVNFRLRHTAANPGLVLAKYRGPSLKLGLKL
jgi:hypothetical protein